MSAFDSGQPLVQAFEGIREAVGVNAHQMQYRGVQVANVDGIFDDIVTEFVCGPVHRATFNAGTGQPNAKALGMVVAAIRFFGEFSLAVNRSPELATPDNQRIIKHAALFEILDERRRGLVDVATLVGKVSGQ